MRTLLGSARPGTEAAWLKRGKVPIVTYTGRQLSCPPDYNATRLGLMFFVQDTSPNYFAEVLST